MNISKKLEQLEREIIKLVDRNKSLYAENLNLKEEIKILKERERHLLTEIEKIKGRKNDVIKRKLEKLSEMIEKEIIK